MLSFHTDKQGRLDKLIAEQLPSTSRGKIQKAIKDGLVSVNGQKVRETDFQIKPADRIELPEFGSTELVPGAIKLQVVFENQDLAVLDKPAGLMVHPAAGRADETLAHALLAQFPEIKNVGDPHRPGIVHRLDEDTSGLLVVAKNQTAYEYLKGLFASRNIEKYYLALVHGVPENLHGIIDKPIGKTSTHQKMKVGVGREAKTEYSVLAQTPSGQFALLRVKLHTGRTHQIRVHLASIGHPIVGDQLYGGEHKLPDSQILPRQFLHAYKLKLQLLDGTWIDVFSDLPEELNQVLKKSGINYDNSKL